MTSEGQGDVVTTELSPRVTGSSFFSEKVMAPGSMEKGAGSPPSGWTRRAYRFITDRNDFRRNLLVNLGLFAAGVWAARNMTDIDLMAPQPGM
ncbi:mitochondrial import receptor subunit TOM6 homolog [Mixophyes fleayi]|uniref:mitochondrial import receptor subunit TOM6 homolog n=1 Tax=Mixophyes fleayi TaxID=3061075 RepID=UPI003F4E0519